MRAVPAIIGVLLLGLALFGAIGLSGEGTIEANVPPCLPLNECDAGVTHETLDLPTMTGWLQLTATVSWSMDSAWLGVIEEGLPDDCVSLPTHQTCDEDDLVFVAGGPDSDGEFSWDAKPGHYRFASGADSASSSLRENTVDYSWQATLSPVVLFIFIIIGIALLVYSFKSWS